MENYQTEPAHREPMYESMGTPETLPLLPLRGIVVLPHSTVHFDAGRKKSVIAIEYAMKEPGHHVFLVAQKDSSVDNPDLEDLYSTGTVAEIKQVLRLPEGGLRVMVNGLERAELLRIRKRSPYLLAEVSRLGEVMTSVHTELETEALIRHTQEVFEEYAAALPRVSPDLLGRVLKADDPGELADFIAANIMLKVEDKELVLSLYDPYQRLLALNKILEREYKILDLEQIIHEQVRDELDKNQKEYYLREQIKVIQQELGEGDGIDQEVENYRERISKLQLPEDSQEHLLKEADRLLKMPYNSSEGSVVRTYLDTCLDLPWNEWTKDRLDIRRAKKILDADHYGIEKVKERILEFLSVRKLTDRVGGEILCLVGPPGVGKTSIAISVAKALNLKLARLSLGGVRDEADIRGHRKTYIGAMPGRIITALTQAGSANPVILLDEVDKLGNDFRGDPASALLEVLDSEQNKGFRDHFVEIPVDLSQVLFLTTANTLETIPRPLLDRMEMIELNTYSDMEKLEIAKQHLLPKQLEKHGLKKVNLKISDQVLLSIISGYTKEAGVRNLEREIGKLCRKAAIRIATEEGETLRVTEKNLEELLGPARSHPDTIPEENQVGVVTGLAWTSLGGEILEIEVNVTEGTGKLELTGSLGDVMKESAKAAISFIRSRADSLKIPATFYKDRDIHIHVPEGAIPKDGPSAGLAMTTALVSELTGRPVRREIAMTGEVTIRGRALPIGGLKEKTMAACKAGVTTVILPRENRADLREIDSQVREKLQFVFVANADEALQNALVN